MSGKYEKKKKTGKQKRWLGVLLILLLAAVAAVVVFLLYPELLPGQKGPEHIGPTFQMQIGESGEENLVMDLDDGLIITHVGAYTGMYVEDGSNEIVSGVLMLVLKNESDSALQYAQISLAAGEETAQFSVSTLPAGASVVLLEQNRMNYDRQTDYCAAEAQHVAWFAEPLTLCEDKIKIQPMDGALNVTNISGADIDGEINIYFKNISDDMLYGGITYRVRLTEGLKAEELRQVFSEHYSADGSTVMFVTCG